MQTDAEIADLLNVPSSWVDLARRNGFASFLSSQDHFSMELTNRDELVGNHKRCGIYFWVAENGEAYVGQAVDIRSRLRTHFKFNPDLLAAAYLECPADRLGDLEVAKIKRLERVVPLRNILLVKSSARHRPLDRIVTSDDQRQFVERGNIPGWADVIRRPFPVLERRQRVRMMKMRGEREKLELAQHAVALFAAACIPDPIRTEHRFWSVTAINQGGLIVRLNAGVQEVLTVHRDPSGPFVRVMCPVSLNWRSRKTGYRSGAREHVMSFDECAGLLEHRTRCRPIREHVLELMRHTTSLNARSHCPEIFQPKLVAKENANVFSG